MIDELARCPDPCSRHAELRERGAHHLPDGRWVVATAADVTAVLQDPRAAIGFTPDPARPIGALQARMARFTDGPQHAPRRAAAERLLCPPGSCAARPPQPRRSGSPGSAPRRTST